MSDSPSKTVRSFNTQWTHVYFRLASVARTISQTPLHQRQRDEAFDFPVDTHGDQLEVRGGKLLANISVLEEMIYLGLSLLNFKNFFVKLNPS